MRARGVQYPAPGGLYSPSRSGASLKAMRLVKPVRWNSFLLDFALLQAALAVFGLAHGMIVRADLGTAAWSVLEVALAPLLGGTPGTMSIMVGLLVLAVSLAAGESVGWGTIVNMLSFGLWFDLALAVIPDLRYGLAPGLAMFGTAILLIGLATGLYIGIDVGAGPRDSLMLALHRRTGLKPGYVRMCMDVVVVLAGWLLGGPVGVGTLGFALLSGPAIQLGFRVFDTERKIAARRGAVGG